ncbi:hypothetical protein L7F22_062772 [Adiantum nelumboides]|nr:hypothetical protein [Adiantum nelumboides]
MASITFVVSDKYCAPRPVELTMMKKASRDSFQVSDSDGRLIFKMDAHPLSIHERCTLLDTDGNLILTARRKLLSRHEKWEVCRGEHFCDESLLFMVKRKSWVQLKAHLTVSLRGNDDNGTPDFEVRGNYKETEGQILQGDKLVAEFKRKFTFKNAMLGKDTFVTWVAPGVDQAFITCLVIIVDRMYNAQYAGASAAPVVTC